MKHQTISFVHKGKEYSEKIALPEDLKEAVKVLGEARTYNDFVQGYKLGMKKEILGVKPKRKRFMRLNIETLNEEQRKILQNLKLI